MKPLFISAFLIFFLGSSCTISQAAQTVKPKQIIIITLDTTRPDYLGCYGNKEVKTPRIDTLAKDSVLFTNCFSTTEFTLASHTSIFTSFYMKDHGITTNGKKLPDFPDFLPKLLKSSGYKTAAFTSDSVLDKNSNISQGFDEFNAAKDRRRAGETNKFVFNWLDRNKHNKFFLWIHYIDPHMPYDPPAPYNTMYKNASAERLSAKSAKNEELLEYFFGEYLKQSNDPEHYRNLYKGSISYLDAQLGKLFDRLKDLGIYHNSCIIVLADHGEPLGEHGTFFFHNQLYDEDVRIPLIFKSRKENRSGPREQLVSSIDIYPTVLDIAGVGNKKPIRGKSILKMINNSRSPEIHDALYYQLDFELFMGIKTREYTYIRQCYEFDKGRRDNGFRLSIKGFIDDAEGHQELYDNGLDRGQLHDISGSRHDIAAEFDSKAKSFIKDRYNTPAQ